MFQSAFVPNRGRWRPCVGQARVHRCRGARCWALDHVPRFVHPWWIRMPPQHGRVPLAEGLTSIMARTKYCLLIVDDEPNVCDSVHDLLRREFRVLKAHSADEGYRLMQEEEVHIVMSDQRMPQISGVELLTKVKARYPQAIRMLFTGFADLESVIAAINQGHIFQFVRKPWQPEELQLAVRHAASEYDRLERTAREREHLLEEIKELKDRLSTLESEVRRLGVIEEPPI